MSREGFHTQLAASGMEISPGPVERTRGKSALPLRLLAPDFLESVPWPRLRAPVSHETLRRLLWSQIFLKTEAVRYDERSLPRTAADHLFQRSCLEKGSQFPSG